MDKKTGQLTSAPSLKPLHITQPSIVINNRSFNTEYKHEYDSLLTRNRLNTSPIRSFPANNTNLEQGRHAPIVPNDADWQVLKVLQSPFCVPTPHQLELVQLKHVNYGVRWTNVHELESLEPKCLVGPHWHLMVITWFILCFLTFVVNVLTFEKATLVEVLTGGFLSAMCLVCYALVGCSNPGIVTRITMPLDDTYTYCDYCDSYRPEGALHCMDCRVCIEEYDHHCPWTSKCVGKGNIRYFYAWLLFLVLAFVYEVIEFATYLLPPDGPESFLDSSDDSLEIIFPVITPISHL